MPCKQATIAVAAERFAKLACALDDEAAAHQVTKIADVYVAWLRRPRHGPVANFPKNQSGNVWSGNKLYSGQTITV